MILESLFPKPTLVNQRERQEPADTHESTLPLPPSRPGLSCQSCEHQFKGWCRAVPGKDYFNIAFLRGCPLESPQRELPSQAKSFGCLTCTNLNVSHDQHWCRAEPGRFINVAALRRCPRTEGDGSLFREDSPARRPLRLIASQTPNEAWQSMPLARLVPVQFRPRVAEILETNPNAKRILENCKAGHFDCWEALRRVGIDPWTQHEGA